MIDSLIEDILQATVVVQSLDRVVEAYTGYLGYRVREEGQLEKAYAEVLGAPLLAQARFAVLGSADGSPGAVRFIEDPAIEIPDPLTTWGWSALEITVRDCDGLCRELQQNSPFRHYSGPADLKFQDGPPAQRAFQAIGPGGELLYLTQILRHNSLYRLPTPGQNATVGRIFIMVLNASNYSQALDFYTGVLGMPKLIEASVPLRLVNRALNLLEGTQHMLATVGTRADTMLEIDGYSVTAQPRPVQRGHLPTSGAIVTFRTARFDEIVERCRTAGVEFRLFRAGTEDQKAIIVAPGGEIIELVR